MVAGWLLGPFLGGATNIVSGQQGLANAKGLD